MFLPINNILPLATNVVKAGEKKYNSTFIRFQIAGNQQSEERGNTCNFLEILQNIAKILNFLVV